MGQHGGSAPSGSAGQMRGLLTSPGFLVGAAILIVSAFFANSGSAGLAEIALVVAIAGYVVAGALAPPWPFLTGFLLALIHGTTAVAAPRCCSVMAISTSSGSGSNSGSW